MLKTLSIRNFRNLDISDLQLGSGVTIVVGGNGQGKTNLIEAVYLLSYGKPFHGTRSEAINWNESNAEIFGETSKGSIRIFLYREGETKIIINNKTKPATYLLGRLATVLFHPGEIELIGGPPAARRVWLDKLIATINRGYLFNLINYNKTLINRNKLLKISGGNATEEQLETWDRLLAKYGIKLWQEREKEISSLNRILNKISKGTIGKNARIEYTVPINLESEGLSKKEFLRALKNKRGVERRLIMTTFGPHRDDLKLVVEEELGQSILEKDLGPFGSRAEKRQAIILLNLAQAQLFSRIFGEPPVILLDDVTSELDEKNRGLLLTHISARQILITTTSLDLLTAEFKKRARVLNMVDGKIIEP
ncbi:MAG: hypothetical protein A2172_00840 [Candidatus Woykebacteria bacterium RBG_13_40_15]|uniref:DNA replication and repair protein RecF n=1 Tax=Candidatus Woykebacteria bacterium RBG_13_40_15 TaxID=1802593 RepID=A0A1G1W8T3_9BACT|nr:MAG: hypothetical protein A2172_00840 [Candidatus Woykebacteria bacterium RBG_13_40_15]